MLYPIPKKIQLAPSTAKWTLQSTQSVLVIVGIQHLRALSAEKHELMLNLTRIINKAKALDIPIIDLYAEDPIQGMLRLGEQLATRSQIIVAGHMSSGFKTVLAHIASLSEQICIVNDAVYLASQAQHIQWMDRQSATGLHHINTAGLNRLWALTAPRDYILSRKGIVYAIAEQLDMDPLDIDPSTDLRDYGLDSVAQVTLVGLWRANGARVRYDDLLIHSRLEQLIDFVQQSAQPNAAEQEIF